MDKKLIFELATGRFITQREDGLFLGPPGTGKSHLAAAVGHTAIHQGFEVRYKEAHLLVEELADATLAGTRKDYLKDIACVPLLIIEPGNPLVRTTCRQPTRHVRAGSMIACWFDLQDVPRYTACVRERRLAGFEVTATGWF